MKIRIISICIVLVAIMILSTFPTPTAELYGENINGADIFNIQPLIGGSFFNVTSNIVINPTLSIITVNNISIWGSLQSNVAQFDFLLNQNITPYEETENVSEIIKSEILSEDAEILLYIQKNPDVINIISDAIIEILNETPELIEDIDALLEEVELKIINTPESLNLQESPQTCSLSWWDIIKYFLRYLMPTVPGMYIYGISSWNDRESIFFVVDTGGSVWAVTVEADGNIIGTVGEGLWTWPWSEKEFYADFSTPGDHYVIAYPTFLKNVVKELRNIFTNGFLTRIYKSTYSNRILPINISHDIKFTTSVYETIGIPIHIIPMEIPTMTKITVNPATKNINITVNNVTATTLKSLEIYNNKLYMNCSVGKKIVNIAPDIAIQQANISKINTVKLQDRGKPIYKIQGTMESKLLWFIPVDMEVISYIDAETGAIEEIEKPWWGFLAF